MGCLVKLTDLMQKPLRLALFAAVAHFFDQRFGDEGIGTSVLTISQDLRELKSYGRIFTNVGAKSRETQGFRG